VPILPAEPSVYPDNLFTDPPPADGGEWRALHTKPRQEKSLARDLRRRAVRFYLPTVRRRRLVRGRALTSELPLFAGYLFVLGSLEQCLAPQASHRIVRMLPVPDQGRLWAELRQLHRLLASGLSVVPVELLPGLAVEIVDGPLAGFRGRVIRSASEQRFVVEVNFISRGAAVLCDGLALRPVPAARRFPTAASG
jgi:transcription antitermination factor NusG